MLKRNVMNMTYSNKFVACVLLNGQPQQELANGVVKLPFNSEYSLRFRNKNNRRAVVKIFIDGENVSGNGYIISANDYVDIKRHREKDRSFKFVSLDSPEAVDEGKNGPNHDKSKGVIEAHFYLEKEQLKFYPLYNNVEHHHHHHYPSHDPYIRYGVKPTWTYSDANNDLSVMKSPTDFAKTSSVGGMTSCHRGLKSTGLESYNSVAPVTELKDGCTVMGESTGQTFYTQHIEVEETATILKLFLQGWEDKVVCVEKKQSKKDLKIVDLEAENERLRRELAEIENAKLKKKLSRAKRKKKVEE